MVDQITASAETLMHQASDTADEYLARAIRAVEEQLGPGAVAKYPQIVAAHMQAAASDFHAAMVRVSTQELEDNVGTLAFRFEQFVDYLNTDAWIRASVTMESGNQESRI